MIYALIWKRVERDWRNCFVNLLNRGLGGNSGLDFLFVDIMIWLLENLLLQMQYENGINKNIFDFSNILYICVRKSEH